MTQSASGDFSVDPEVSAGPSPDFANLTLQRGGEELLLTKVGDRLTTRLRAASGLSQVQQQLHPIAYRPVATGQLIEWQVAPSQLEQALTTARSLDSVLFASHVYRLSASPQTWIYLTEQMTVQFAPDLSAPDIAAILAPLGLQQQQALVGMPNTYVLVVSAAATDNPIKLANQLISRPDVLAAEPNIVIATGHLYRPQDERYGQQWHLYHRGGPHLAAGSHIDAEAAWEITRGSRSVVIAISDDGFDLDHPDLQGMGKLVDPLDLRDHDAIPLPMSAEENHGTAVAGLAVGEENGTGIVGVAPGCAFMPIRTTGFIDDESIEHLFNQAVSRGADVISCSWAPASVYFPLTLRQQNAITQAATHGRNGKGCVVVFSAGNANRPVSGTVVERGWPQGSLQGETKWLSGFAVHPDVIAVSASTSLGRKAAYSNWGEHIALAAPSNNAPPNVALPELGTVPTGPPLPGGMEGLGMVTSDRIHGAGYGPDSYTNQFGGTSSSCPVVAGVVGLMLSVNPQLTAQEVRQVLQLTADKIVDLNPDPQLGFKYGTYDQNGHSRWFGYGKVNAAKAVKAAQEMAQSSRVTGKLVKGESQMPLAIPDGQPAGVSSTIQINQVGRVESIQVTVGLDHEFLGDVSLTLTAPKGRQVLIQGRTLGHQTRLQKTYSLDTTPVLLHLIGEAAAGTWRLTAIDAVAGATGRLQYWSLELSVG